MTGERRNVHKTDDIAGIDGCKDGWIIATPRGVSVVRRLQLDQFEVAGVDMPIGLAEISRRACDVAARKYLRRARSSVFPSPPRAVLGITDYQTALAVARAATGRGISKQTFNITRKITELDALVDASTEQRVIEVHPECSFRLMNDEEPLPSKKMAEGRLLRRRLLADHFDVPEDVPRGAAVDDLLDAYAVLWTAQRFSRGEHTTFGDGQRDARGLEMRIAV
jgi:predicted RNase H-like nuclease